MTQVFENILLVAKKRMQLSLVLISVLFISFAVFYGLIAFNKPLMSTTVIPGLSLGILLGVLMFPLTWVIVGTYVAWSNARYDRAVDEARLSLSSKTPTKSAHKPLKTS